MYAARVGRFKGSAVDRGDNMRFVRAAPVLLMLLIMSMSAGAARPGEAAFQTSISSPCYIGLPCKVRVNLTVVPPGVTITGLRLSLPWGLENLLPVEISPNILETTFTPPLGSKPGIYYALPQLVGREKTTGRLVIFSGSPTMLRLSEPDLVGRVTLKVDEVPITPGGSARVNVTYLVLNLPPEVSPKLDILVNGTKVYSSPLAESSGSVVTSVVAPEDARRLQITARLYVGLYVFENSTLAFVAPEKPAVNLEEALVLIEAANQSLMQAQLLLGRAASQGVPVFEAGAADLLASADYLLYEARRAAYEGNASAARLAILAFNLTQEALAGISSAYVSLAESRVDDLNSTLQRLKNLGAPGDLLGLAAEKLKEAANLTEAMRRTEPTNLPDLYERLDAVLLEASAALEKAEKSREDRVSRLTAFTIVLTALLPLFYSYVALRAWRRLLRSS